MPPSRCSPCPSQRYRTDVRALRGTARPKGFYLLPRRLGRARVRIRLCERRKIVSRGVTADERMLPTAAVRLSVGLKSRIDVEVGEKAVLVDGEEIVKLLCKSVRGVTVGNFRLADGRKSDAVCLLCAASDRRRKERYTKACGEHDRNGFLNSLMFHFHISPFSNVFFVQDLSFLKKYATIIINYSGKSDKYIFGFYGNKK